MFDKKMSEYLTLKELATHLRVTYQTARKLVVSGKIKAYKIGYMWLIPKQGLEEQLEELTIRSVQRTRKQDKEPC